MCLNWQRSSASVKNKLGNCSHSNNGPSHSCAENITCRVYEQRLNKNVSVRVVVILSIYLGCSATLWNIAS